MNNIKRIALPPWGRYKPVVMSDGKYDDAYGKSIVSKIRNIMYTINKNDYPEFEYCRFYDQRTRDYVPGVIVKGYPSTKWSYIREQLKRQHDIETMPVSIEEDTSDGHISEYLIYMSPLDAWEKRDATWKEIASRKRIDAFDENSIYPKWQGRRPTLYIDDVTPYDAMREEQLMALAESLLGYDIDARYCRMHDPSGEFVGGLIIAKGDEQWDAALRELEEKYHVASTEIDTKGAKFVYVSPFYEWDDAEFWESIREEVDNL